MKDVAGVLVKHRDKCLLCKRAPGENLEGYWSIPCGGVKPKEDLKVAAVREFREETYLVLNPQEVSYVTSILNSNKKKVVTSILHVFYTRATSIRIPNLEKAKDGFEHTECRYFGLNEVDDLKITPKLKEIIKKALAN
jgi:ADP-ribose pyrophosphatase YjhB (NUDIX family)